MAPKVGQTPLNLSATGMIGIGWKECVDFPEWGIEGILAKSDTGAYSSAIDVRQIEKQPDGSIEFAIALDRKKPPTLRRVHASVVQKTRVRSSNGDETERYRVSTLVRIGNLEKRIELSLVARPRMMCRVLLGRRALAPEFLVDSAHAFLLSAEPESIPKPKRGGRKRPGPRDAKP